MDKRDAEIAENRLNNALDAEFARFERRLARAFGAATSCIVICEAVDNNTRLLANVPPDGVRAVLRGVLEEHEAGRVRVVAEPAAVN